MTTFVIIFNAICGVYIVGLGVFVLIKRHQNKKEALKKLKEYEENETKE